MGSRLRENPVRLLECWCEVVGPQGSDRPPWILQKFPNSYNDKEILKSVPQFAFPCTFDRSTVQHFSFVLTSLDSKWTYGYCRHAPGQETAIVILSHLPWHQTFYKLLNHLSELMSNDKTSDLTACLQSAYKSPIPHPGSDITIPYGNNKFFVGHCPDHRKLPTIPENRNLSEYYNAVDANNMAAIFASMLHERRIIVVSKRVSRLSACVQAANALIYPMQWQHIFIPVLPQHLTDYLLAPMPFLIGVSTALLSKVQMEDVGEAVILDADNNSVRTPFSDLQALPEEVLQSLRRNLKAANNALGDGVARAFLRALVQLIGNYKEALQFRDQDKKITFSKEKFVSSRPAHYKQFVEKMLDLQIFQQFIEERLERLNGGRQTSDEFELEASVYSEKGGGGRVKQQYKHFVTSVRKEGGAIVKTMKSKTNPAVKSAVKTVTKGGKQVKERSRQISKDLRGRLKDLQVPQARGEDSGAPWMNGEGPKKPQSAPSSPTHSTRRRQRASNFEGPPGFSARATYKRASHNLRDDNRPRKYDLIESGNGGGLMSPGSTDSLSTPSPQSIDLMGEMEEIIRAKLGQDGDQDYDDDDFDDEDEDDESLHSSSSQSSRSSIRNSLGSESATGSTNTVMAAQQDADSPTSLQASHKDGSAQDLIFLESPQDEIFDPLLSKDISSSSSYKIPLSTSASSSKIPSTLGLSSGKNLLSTSASSSKIHPSGSSPIVRPRHPPPAVPTTPTSTIATIKSAPSLQGVGSSDLTLTHSLSDTRLPSSTPPHRPLGLAAPINTTGLPNATPTHPLLPNSPQPRPPTAYQPVGSFRPFSSIQKNLGTPVGCQNPLYNQHQPPALLPTTTRAGNAAAAFASKMLSNGAESRGAMRPPGATGSGPYVQFEPPYAPPRSNSSASHNTSPSLNTKPIPLKPSQVLGSAAGTTATPQRPPRLSQKDLLGDFSKDFQKLTVNSSATRSPDAQFSDTTTHSATLGTINSITLQGNNNNNTTMTNNNESGDQGTEDKNETRWTTFD